MKKYIQILVVIALVVATVAIAKSSPAWASVLTSPAPSNPAVDVNLAAQNAAQPLSIVVTGSGKYLVGGVCQMDITYTATDLKDQVDAEVPVEDSKKVPFSGDGDLFYPGCHVVHYKLDKIVDTASANDGSWKVCFGKRPDIQLTIYYYLDNPSGGAPVWLPLPTTVEGEYACAPALFTGVYMPSGRVDRQPAGIGDATIKQIPAPRPGGTVQVPPLKNTITKSGRYSVGGICGLEVFYKVKNLSDSLYVELPVEDNLMVSFPDNGDLLFFPGCHVLHYELSAIQKQMGVEKGTWEICFAAQPNKQMTIYRYESLIHKDDHGNITPPWIPLTTTMKNGLACAPAEFTGVYVPAGK